MLSQSKAASKIICALDCSANEAFALADTLEGRLQWVKVGMTLFYQEGPSIVERFCERGLKVFLDLKLFDIPFQVEGAAKAAAATGAHLISVHGLGGAAMIAAAKKGLQAAQGSVSLGDASPRLVAITVLTSLDAQTLATLGVDSDLEREVERLAWLAMESGASGVVCSPLEVKGLRDLLGPKALLICPGVRPAHQTAQDQRRVATPAAALQQGASKIVVGRPLTAATHPKAAFDAIVCELRQALD